MAKKASPAKIRSEGVVCQGQYVCACALPVWDVQPPNWNFIIAFTSDTEL